MRRKLIFMLSCLFAILVTTSCEKAEEKKPAPDTRPFSYSGKKAAQVRQQTVDEIVAVKNELKKSIVSSIEKEDLSSLISDLDTLRPRLEYIQMETAMLPKNEQYVVRGTLAVATNQLERDLRELLAHDPANDELVLKIAHLRNQLSPLLTARSNR